MVGVDAWHARCLVSRPRGALHNPADHGCKISLERVGSAPARRACHGLRLAVTAGAPTTKVEHKVKEGQAAEKRAISE